MADKERPMSDYRYLLEVDDNNGVCTARLGHPEESNEHSPLTGTGPTPLEAVRALCETLKQWPISGAQQWLESPDGKLLAARFVRKPGDKDPFAPPRGKAKAAPE
jgi:hypothetical protein